MHNRTCYFDVVDDTWIHVLTLCDVQMHGLLTLTYARIHTLISASLIEWPLTAAQKAYLNHPCPHQQCLFMEARLVQSHLC